MPGRRCYFSHAHGAWLDGGAHEALFDAAQFIRVIEERTGPKITGLEEVAIGLDDVRRQAEGMPAGIYGDYLRQLVAVERTAAG